MEVTPAAVSTLACGPRAPGVFVVPNARRLLDTP